MAKIKVSYKPLFKLLVDKNMRKKDLCALAGVSTASVTKMGKSGHITTEVLGKVCRALDCDLSDIFEFIYLDEE